MPNGSPTISPTVTPQPDYLYGNFQKARERNNQLYEDIVRKSVNIPAPMGEGSQVKSDTTYNVGTNQRGWAELAILAAVVLGGFWLYSQSQKPPQPDAVIVEPQPQRQLEITPLPGE